MLKIPFVDYEKSWHMVPATKDYTDISIFSLVGHPSLLSIQILYIVELVLVLIWLKYCSLDVKQQSIDNVACYFLLLF